MREPDVITGGDLYGWQNHAWRVPIDRVHEWVKEHPERMTQESRDERFPLIWRDLWYLHGYVYRSDSLEVASHAWFAVSLRDLRQASSDVPRLYKEAEWELTAEDLGLNEPPVNGEALHDGGDAAPIFVYQFHGLPERGVLHAADVIFEGTTKPQPVSFAIFGLAALEQGPRPLQEVYEPLSRQVNALRDGMFALPPLRIGTGSPVDPLVGMLSTLDNGEWTTPAALFSE